MVNKNLSEQKVYHDVTTGESIEVEGSTERERRVEAATRLGCDRSDLRRGYDHSGREPEDTKVADELLRKALRPDDDSGGSS